MPERFTLPTLRKRKKGVARKIIDSPREDKAKRSWILLRATPVEK